MTQRIIVFPSVHHTLCGEKAFKKHGVEHQVVPVPPHINEGCGLGIKIGEALVIKALEILEEEDVKSEKVV